MTTLFNPLVETHINQNYGSFHQEIPFDDLIRKYAILPNEAVYLVECRTAQLEPLTSNFNDIIGIDILHPKDITILYEHVHPTAMQPFMQFTHKVVQCGFEKSIKLQEERDFILSVYQTHDRRTILKSTCVLFYDSNQTMRYTLGKLIDVTGLMPFNHFSYKFAGPASEDFCQRLDHDDQNSSLLGKREVEVLELVGKGKSSQEIANKLFISKNTVDKHRRNIIKKMNCQSSFEAFAKAKNLGVF